MSARLTPKQQLFVSNLIRLNYNATAAIKATYGDNPHPPQTQKWQLWEASARARGTQLLAKVNVSEAVRIAQRRAIEKAAVDEDMIIAALAAIAFTNLDDVAPWDEQGLKLLPSEDLPWRFKSAVKGLTVTRRTVKEAGEDGETYQVERTEWRMHDKVSAIKLLMQHFGMLPRGVRITAEPGSEVNVDARAQSLLVTEKLATMTPEEILEAAMRLPAEDE